MPQSEPRRLGLIFPPAGRGVPEEGLAMYGGRIDYLIECLGLETMTPAGYEAVQQRIGPAAERLAERGAEAILLTGTSLTFYRGEAYNRELILLVQALTGLPTTSMSTAMLDALHEVGGRNLAVATAYNDEVNARLQSWLESCGFSVVALRGLGIEAVADLGRVTQDELLEFSAAVAATAPQADTLFVSCGGLRTLEILDPLEARTGLPVVSSMPHTLLAGARLLGMETRLSGFGRLLSV